MGFFGFFEGKPKPAPTEVEKEAKAFLDQLEQQGVTDKGVVIEGVEGVNETKRFDERGNPIRASYVSQDKKSA